MLRCNSAYKPHLLVFSAPTQIYNLLTTIEGWIIIKWNSQIKNNKSLISVGHSFQLATVCKTAKEYSYKPSAVKAKLKVPRYPKKCGKVTLKRPRLRKKVIAYGLDKIEVKMTTIPRAITTEHKMK